MRRAGESFGDAETFDAEELLKALRAGLDGIQGLGAAQEGDKTIVDAYAPALAAFERELRAGGDAASASRKAADAARDGVRATVPMQARKGRASYLGPRSVGHQDPGATSTGYLFSRSRAPSTVGRDRPEPASGERRGTIRSVERAARILKVLGTGTSRMGVTEIAERLGLAKGTAYGLLRTLEAQELVEQDPETDKYRLGPAMLQLGNAFLDNHELRARSLLWADSLASRVGEAVRVGVLHGSNVLIVHHVFRPDNSVQILEVGASIPWHACALGKAIAAYLPDAQRRALLESDLMPLTGRTVIDPAALEATLAAVADDGSALEDEEAIVGEAEIAAPVFDDQGHSVGAIGVVGPVERLVTDGRPAPVLLTAVRETSRGLSRDMGAGRSRARGGSSRR